MRNLCSTFLFGRYSRLRFPLPEAKATAKAFRESSTYAGAQRRVFLQKMIQIKNLSIFEMNERIFTFLENYKLNTANLYPSIPKPESTAFVYAAVTDFCLNSSR